MSGQTATAAGLGRRVRLTGLPPGTLALRVAVTLVIAFVAVWVAYKAYGDPRTFVIVGLNGLTLAGLYFVVASGLPSPPTSVTAFTPSPAASFSTKRRPGQCGRMA